MKSILILLHCESNTGYAIGPLEKTFYDMAMNLCEGDSSRVHFAYPSMEKGPSATLPAEFNQYTIIDAKSSDPGHGMAVERYFHGHNIDTVFGFDQPVHRSIYKYFRRGGVRRFISYWGAPMSSVNNGVIRLLKRLDVCMHPAGPDHYIFESFGMGELAVKGRGIPPRRVSVVPQGVDCQRYRPNPADVGYVYEHLGIPRGRRIFFYSGHMEPRKGIATIMKAANLLIERRSADDWHVLLCGNKGEESAQYEKLLTEGARTRVTFAGYRGDLEVLHRGCYAALLATTGWDSFPRSGLEAQSSGLPLLVSDLIGVRELVRDGVTGLVLKAGDEGAWANGMGRLLDDSEWRAQLSWRARERIEGELNIDKQIHALTDVVRSVACRPPS